MLIRNYDRISSVSIEFLISRLSTNSGVRFEKVWWQSQTLRLVEAIYQEVVKTFEVSEYVVPQGNIEKRDELP